MATVTAVGGDFGEQPPLRCWCCGSHDVATGLLQLEQHREVAVCFRCVDWLADRKRTIERINRLAPPGPWWRRLLFRAGFNRC